jgi:hypothetical protein
MKRILVCGISGTKAATVAEQLAADLTKVHPAFSTKLEDLVCQECGTEIFHRRCDITEVLTLPVPEIRKYLKRGWEDVFALEKDRNAEYHVISCHLVYHPQLTSSFFALTDTPHFKDPDNPPDHSVYRIIVVVDDVFDLFSRLPDFTNFPPDMPLSRESEVLLSDLSDILRWRDHELSRAHTLAHALGADHFVVANKHHRDTFRDLAIGEKKTIYISHPITQVREAGIASEESDLFVRMLHALADELKRSFVVFAPATIDEFRFRSYKYDVKTDDHEDELAVFLPVVLPRWPNAFSPAIPPTNWMPFVSEPQQEVLDELDEFFKNLVTEHDLPYEFLQYAKRKELDQEILHEILSLL